MITTDSNKQLSFLHDRMPVILDNGSDEIRTWLDPGRSEWSKELQSLLKPYNGELECYPVDKAVGKVGNNSPSFIVPVASSENKNNIANFFGNAKKAAKGSEEKKALQDEQVKTKEEGSKIEHESDEKRETVEQDSTEANAPLPVPTPSAATAGYKRDHDEVFEEGDTSPPHKFSKTKDVKESPTEHLIPGSGRKLRSATSNGSKGSPVKAGDGSQRITNFFNK